MTTSPLRIGLLGSGAIGSLMAYHWREQTLVALPRDQQSSTHIQVQHHEQCWQAQLPCWQGEPLDWLVLCTKAGDSLNALSAWRTYLPNVKRILLLQNGMGQHDECQHWLEQENLACELWAAMSTEGAYRTETTVHYAGQGETLIGAWQTSQTISVMALPQTRIVADIHTHLRTKLAINAVINPLTALLHCPNGELLSQANYRQQLLALSDEVAALYQALNWHLPQPLTELVLNVAQRTAHNRSSTLQDVLNQRPTELPYISGYLQKQAQTLGMELPITTQLLKQLTKTNA